MTDTLIHLDGLEKLAERAAAAHEVGLAADGKLEYEKFGVCTADLLGVAHGYSGATIKQAIEDGAGVMQAMLLQFLAGFDIGYQARIEVETRELLLKDLNQNQEPDPEDLERLRGALEVLVAEAARYLDTGRGDLDGVLDLARAALVGEEKPKTS